jgi:pimeloyl-ACP methyl ester carboxylesterase
MTMVLKVIAGVAALLVLLIGGFIIATWAPELSVAELQGRWAPPPSVFVDLLGMKVHLRDEGPREDKSPIVLLHGMGSSLHAWDGWAEALRGERRVIRFDQAGFGLTGPSADGIYGGENDMRLLIAVLDKLGVERCVLGGNSLGGGVSLRTALEHPSRVEKLIIVDGGGGGGYQSAPESQPIGFHLLRIPGVGWLLQHSLPRFLVEQGFRNVFGDPQRVTAEMVDRSVALTRREGNRGAIVERFRQRRPGTLGNRIPELKLPTLIVWGGRDRLVPVAVAHRLHRDIAGSTLAIFDDLGHAPEEEDPARTVAAVKQFLQLPSGSR